MNRIKEIANQKRIKISKVIKTSGLSKSFIYDVINEESFPTTPNAHKIAKALNSDISEVFPSNE